SQQQRIAQEGVALQQERVLVQLVYFGDADALVAVVREHPREAAADRKPHRRNCAGRFLSELADVADVGLEQIESAGDVAIEQERLGKRKRVVLRARTGLQ